MLRLNGAHSDAAATLAGLIASPAYRELQALLARRDHVASLQAHAATLAGQRAAAEKRVFDAVGRITSSRRRLDGDLARVGDGVRAADRHARATTVRLPLPDPPALRTTTLDTGVQGPDADALAGVDVRAAADAVRARRTQVTDVMAALHRAEDADTACTTALAHATAADEEARQVRELAARARSGGGRRASP